MLGPWYSKMTLSKGQGSDYFFVKRFLNSAALLRHTSMAASKCFPVRPLPDKIFWQEEIHWIFIRVTKHGSNWVIHFSLQTWRSGTIRFIASISYELCTYWPLLFISFENKPYKSRIFNHHEDKEELLTWFRKQRVLHSSIAHVMEPRMTFSSVVDGSTRKISSNIPNVIAIGTFRSSSGVSPPSQLVWVRAFNCKEKPQ